MEPQVCGDLEEMRLRKITDSAPTEPAPSDTGTAPTRPSCPAFPGHCRTRPSSSYEHRRLRRPRPYMAKPPRASPAGQIAKPAKAIKHACTAVVVDNASCCLLKLVRASISGITGACSTARKRSPLPRCAKAACAGCLSTAPTTAAVIPSSWGSRWSRRPTLWAKLWISSDDHRIL